MQVSVLLRVLYFGTLQGARQVLINWFMVPLTQCWTYTTSECWGGNRIWYKSQDSILWGNKNTGQGWQEVGDLSSNLIGQKPELFHLDIKPLFTNNVN